MVYIFDTLLQQTFNLEAAGVYAPLGFGLAVGLAYVLQECVRGELSTILTDIISSNRIDATTAASVVFN